MRMRTIKHPHDQADPSAYEPDISPPGAPPTHVERLTACIFSILPVWKPWYDPQGRKGRRKASEGGCTTYMVYGAALAVHQ